MQLDVDVSPPAFSLTTFTSTEIVLSYDSLIYELLTSEFCSSDRQMDRNRWAQNILECSRYFFRIPRDILIVAKFQASNHNTF